MLECDINDVAIEIINETREQNTQELTVTAPVFPRRSSTTAMDIYSEIRTKREEELLEMIDKKSSQIVELEIKIVKLENDMKQITERDQETSKKKRKLRETCDEDDKVNENLQQQVENLMNRLGERENELHEVREKLAEREWKESDEIKRLEKEVKQLKQRENKDTINTEVKALQKVIETKDKDLQNLKRTNEKLLNTKPIETEIREKLAESEWNESTEINKLKKEIEELKKKDNKENNNIQLKALQKVIDTKDKELQNLQRVNEKLSSKQNEKEMCNTVINESTSTSNELMKMIEERMHSGFNLIQENMEKFIKDKLVEKDPDASMEDVPELPSPTEQRKTYAKVASRSADSQNFRNIMLATKNEELVEQSAKRQRAKNLIVHGKEEQSPEKDALFINELLKALQIGAITAKSIERIGAADPNKGRPIKIVFNSEDDQQKVFLNLKNLKGMNLYKKISIREDYTFTERALVKSFIEQAKMKNHEEETKNSNMIWRVRGTPKNGLTLKKFTRDLKEINPPQY